MTKHDDTAPGEPLALRLSEGLGPLVEELAHRTAWRYAHSRDPHHSDTYTFNRACLRAFADKLVAAVVAAERERCATVCEREICACCWDDAAQAAAEHLAAEIRKGPNVGIEPPRSGRLE